MPIEPFSRVQLPCGLSVLLFQQQGARARAEGASRACCTACIYGGGVVVVILGLSGNSRFWLALVGHRTFSFLSRDKVNTALALFGGPGLNLLKDWRLGGTAAISKGAPYHRRARA